MADEARLALALLAGETVVAAAAPDVDPDVWSDLTRRFAGLFGRGDPDRGLEAERRLDLTQRQMAFASEKVRRHRFGEPTWKIVRDTQIDKAGEWQDWLADVLEDQPERAAGLAEAVRALRTRLGVPLDQSLYSPSPAFYPAADEPYERNIAKPDAFEEHGPPGAFEEGAEPDAGYGYEGATPPGASFGDPDDYDDPERK